jgi:UDP-N-acetylmuramate dehydrogenase
MPQIERDVPLAPRTTFGVGGPARFFTVASSTAEIEAALGWARSERVSSFILGGGSNLVVSDAGIDALVIQITSRGLSIDRRGGLAIVDVAAGEIWDELVAAVVAEGFAGLECLSGIPGAVGATPIQNVGAYGQEVSETIQSLTAIDRETGERVTINASECAFGYRDSAFKHAWHQRFVIAEVRFALRIGGAPSLRYAELQRALVDEDLSLAAVRAKVVELRRAKSMVLDPADENGKSAGSFFMNPIVDTEVADRVEQLARDSGLLGRKTTAAGEASKPEWMPRFLAGEGKTKLAAGWLIERAGFKRGSERGSVGLSTKHALAIVNRGGATAADILAFAREIQDGVESRFGVRLHPEPELVGFPSEATSRHGH